MSVFPEWQRYAVHQRREKTGCIPSGYEMILRAAGAKDIHFDSFQDEFDLDNDLPAGAPPVNHFESVAKAIAAKYPQVVFKHQAFAKNDGQAKLQFIENKLSVKRPVLVSINNVIFQQSGWHIMPVVDVDTATLTLLGMVRADGQPVLVKLPKDVLVAVHEKYPGGEEVAWLESC